MTQTGKFVLQKRNTTQTGKFVLQKRNTTQTGKFVVQKRNTTQTGKFVLQIFIFLSVNNKLPPQERQMAPCCLTLNILNILNCLRVPSAHATPTFSDLKVYVYGMKGIRLWYERYTFMV